MTTIVMHGDAWPRCYYDESLLCGERETGALTGYNQRDPEWRVWHSGDMCRCPSCPLRVAISGALYRAKKDAA